MKRRKWAPKEKLRIVIEGLKGTVPLGELCANHGISQTLFYRWRDQLFDQGEKIFENGGPSKAEDRLRRENEKLKGMVGELTMELKKSGY
jgi:transposase-like protein